MCSNPGLRPSLFGAALMLLMLAESDCDIKVQMKQEPLNVLVHEDVALKCLLIGYNDILQSEKLGVRWKFGEESICSYEGGNLVKNWNNTEIYEEDILKKNMTLILKKVTFNHEGSYRCDVIIAPYHRAAGVTTILVSARPVVTVTSPEVVEVGREASLTCNVNGYYKPSIHIEWIQVKINAVTVISSNVCRSPPRADPSGTYSASVQITVEPTGEDIGTLYACRVKHRSFPQDHTEAARLIVKERTFDRSIGTLIGTCTAVVVTVVLTGISLIVYRKKYHMGDSAYALRNYLMTPYLNPTTANQQRYNAAHISTRNVIERTFGLLKSRFRCLHKSGGALQYNPEQCCKIVAACAMLHNIATKGGMEIEVSDSELEDGNQQVPHHCAAQEASAAEGRRRRLDITQNYF